MKIKSLLLSLVVVALYSCSSDSSVESPATSNSSVHETSKWPTDGSVSVHWEIGRRSRHCDGFGICRYIKTVVTVDPFTVDLGELRATNTFYGNAHIIDDTHLLVVVDPTSLTYINEFFGSNAIIFEEDTEFDFSDLGIGLHTIKVKAGTIPITYDAETKQYGFILENN